MRLHASPLSLSRWLRPLVVALLLPATASAASSGTRADVANVAARAAALPLTVVMTSDTALTLDSNSPATAGPHAQYVAFKITNTSGAAVTNLTATLSGFTSVSLAGSQAAGQYIGTLAAGASKTIYWFVTYPSTFGNRSVLTVNVTDGAGGTASGTGAVRTVSMISAQAGGLTSTSTIGPGAVVGQTIPLDVGFQFKGWKVGDTFNLQPAGNETFPAGCFQLLSTSILSADANLDAQIPPGTADRQYFTATSASLGGGSIWNVQVRYIFRYLCSGASGSPLPYSNEISGTQLKYSANYGSGGGAPGAIPPAPAPAADFTVGKSVSSAQMPNGGTVTYTVSVQNISTFNATIDSILDVLPSGVTYTGLAAGSGVTAANSGSVPASGATGTIAFRGNAGSTYTVAAGATLTLTYTASVSATPGTYTNSARAYVGSTELGRASVTVTVGRADVAVTKTGPATAIAGDTMKYAIVLSNVGPSTAYGIVASDVLPTGATFVRATGGGTYASGVVTWPSVTSLALGSTVLDSVIVLAPSSSGSVVNVASAAASSYDPVASNNDGSASTSRVTTVVTVSIAVTPDGLASPTRQLPGTRYSQVFVVSNQAFSSGTYALIATRTGSPIFLTIDSLTGTALTSRPRADSAQALLAARTSYNVTAWYTVAVGDTTTDILILRARNTLTAAVTDTGYVQIRRSFPSLTLVKSVAPSTGIYPGIDLTYTMRFANAGESDAASTVVTDQLPTAVQFKLGSTQQSLPSGVTATVSYSQDGGTTWTYTPLSGGCGAPAGYDACVNRVKWTLGSVLAPSATQSSVVFVARVR